ncbi:MAG TPA: DUF3558 family protein [Pseudonocardiaceae bacterium]
MRQIQAVLALTAVLAGGGLVGCSADPPPVDPIPPVRESRDLAGTPVCALFTPAQLAANQVDLPARPKDVGGDPGCVWGNKAHTREISIFTDLRYDVLHNVYAQRATFPVFELTEVAGHPAIRTKDNVNGTSCYFRVAAAPTQTVMVRFSSLRQGLEEPCGPAKALAATVIGNLPPLKG